MRKLSINSMFFNASIYSAAYFLIKLGQFLIAPYLAIYLSNLSLTPWSIGIIIGAGQLGSSTMSFLTGHLLDKYNPHKCFIMSLIGVGVVYGLLSSNISIIGFILLNIVLGAFRSISDNATKTMLMVYVDKSQRSFALGARYAILNLAAALGPLIIVHYAAYDSSKLLLQIAFCYIFTGILLLFLPEIKSTEINPTPSRNITLGDTFNLLKTIPSLKALFIISFIFYSLYSQISSSLAQYIVNQFDQGVRIYSNILILNAITCVSLQLCVGYFFKKVSLMTLAGLGLSLCSLGFLGFSFAQNDLSLNTSMLFLSIGEVIFFPLNDLLLARIAPPNKLGSCYGILNASTIGLAFGPILGGIIYQFTNHKVLFLICSFVSLLTVLYYRNVYCKSFATPELQGALL